MQNYCRKKEKNECKKADKRECLTAVVQRVILYYTFKRAGEKNMPAKKENRMRKEFEEKDIHQEVRLNKYLSEAGVCSKA